MKSPCLFGIVASLVIFTFHVDAQSIDTIASKNNKQINLPEIGVNLGFVNMLSDVALNQSGPSAFTQFGFQLNITQPIAKFLNVSLNLFTGTVYGEEIRGFYNLNYRTSLFSQQLCVEYNFYPLLKPNAQGKQLIRPYIGFGLGAMFFRSKGDLTSSAGETYNYWTDGTIRSIAENDAYAESAVLLQRDFNYESDLRDANLDGLRKYPQTTFTIPINAGIRFQITKHFGVNAAFTYALNFSEMLDNSGAGSIGTRKSASGNDNHIFGSIGINVFLGAKRTTSIRDTEQTLATTTPNRWGSNKSVEKSNSKSSRPETEVSELVNASGSLDELSTRNSNGITSIQSAENNQSSAVSVNSSENAEVTSKGNSDTIANKKSIDNEQGDVVITTSKASTDATSIADSTVKNNTQLTKTKNNSAEITQFANGTKSNVTGTNQNLSLPDSLSENSQAKKDSDKDIAPIKNDANVKSISASRDSENSNEGKTGESRNSNELTSEEKARTTWAENTESNSAALAENDKAKQTIKDTTLTPSEENKSLQTNAHLKPEDVNSSNPNETKSNQSNQEITTSNSSNQNQANQTKSSKTGNIASSISKNYQDEKTSSNNGQITLKDLQQVSPKATGTFHWADRDENGNITATEVLYFIDSLFDGDGTLTVEDIQNLIDYYFDQE